MLVMAYRIVSLICNTKVRGYRGNMVQLLPYRKIQFEDKSKIEMTWCKIKWKAKMLLFILLIYLFYSHPIYAADDLNAPPVPGGDTTVVSPGGGAVSITEDAMQPASSNIRLVVPTLSDPDGGVPGSIRIISVTGGMLLQNNGDAITPGASGTILTLSDNCINFRFTPHPNRSEDASFQYVVVDNIDNSINSGQSKAVMSMTPVNDTPVLGVNSGTDSDGLFCQFYLSQCDLTGEVQTRIDEGINFNIYIGGFNRTAVWGMGNVDP